MTSSAARYYMFRALGYTCGGFLTWVIAYVLMAFGNDQASSISEFPGLSSESASVVFYSSAVTFYIITALILVVAVAAGLLAGMKYVDARTSERTWKIARLGEDNPSQPTNTTT
jgi:hypothetical protein